MDDHELHINDILPTGIGEESEGVFSSIRSVEDSRKLMLKFGFEENEALTKFCQTHNLTNEVDYEEDENEES
jgi:hypothetical protein